MSNFTEYGELLNETILKIFGSEMVYDDLKFYAKNPHNTTHVKTERIKGNENKLFAVYFDNKMVFEKLYSNYHSCDMFYHLNELGSDVVEDCVEDCDGCGELMGCGDLSASIICMECNGPKLCKTCMADYELTIERNSDIKFLDWYKREIEMCGGCEKQKRIFAQMIGDGGSWNGWKNTGVKLCAECWT